MYRLKIEKRVIKFLKKLDFSIRKDIDKKIRVLEEDPFPRDKKHILASSGASLLCELSHQKWRIYYTIENCFVVIEDIEYDGTVSIIEGYNNHKSGKGYPNQRKDIQRLKKNFRK